MPFLPAHSDKTGNPSTFQSQEITWQFVYERYASLIYGIILQLTTSEIFAKETIIHIVKDLKNQCLLNPKMMNSYSLPKYIYHSIQKCLKESDTHAFTQTPFNKQYPIINSIYWHGENLKQIANKAELTEAEARKRLRAECLLLRGIQTTAISS